MGVQVIEHWNGAPAGPLPPETLQHILSVATRSTQPLIAADRAAAPSGQGHDRVTVEGAQSPGQRAESVVVAQREEQHWLIDSLHEQLALLRRMPQALLDAQHWTPAHERASAVSKVSVAHAPSFRLPNQQNRLALVMDPFTEEVPFTFGVEVFPPGHKTPPHVHTTAHEMFFILSGSGEAFCNGTRFRVGAGDTVVFPPGCEHGIDSDSGERRMYCLELMLPNEAFSEFVRAGQRMEGLDHDDMCVLAAIGCR